MTKTLFRLLLGTLLWAAVAISARAQDALPPQVADGQAFDLRGYNSRSRFEASASLLYLQPQRRQSGIRDPGDAFAVAIARLE